jgi:hypothetical protein
MGTRAWPYRLLNSGGQGFRLGSAWLAQQQAYDADRRASQDYAETCLPNRSSVGGLGSGSGHVNPAWYASSARPIVSLTARLPTAVATPCHGQRSRCFVASVALNCALTRTL